jgi:hypothetical protein
MAYTDYAKLFVNAEGAPHASIEVAESCIDSAEYIIRQIATEGARIARGSAGPDMMAQFGNWEFNASTEEFLKAKKKPLDYPFSSFPKVGEGIILLNKTGSDLPYNMHFGAIVARGDTSAVISHMFQQVRSYIQKPLIALEISSIADFAIKTFGAKHASLFAVGLLKPKK